MRIEPLEIYSELFHPREMESWTGVQITLTAIDASNGYFGILSS